MTKSDRRVKGLGEVSILVRDLDAMRKFYEEFDALETAQRAGTLDDALYRQLSLDYGIEWLE